MGGGVFVQGGDLDGKFIHAAGHAVQGQVAGDRLQQNIAQAGEFAGGDDGRGVEQGDDRA